MADHDHLSREAELQALRREVGQLKAERERVYLLAQEWSRSRSNITRILGLRLIQLLTKGARRPTE